MKLLKPILLIFSCLLTLNLVAQQKLSWKKHLKLADELFKNAQYADAGEHYRSAWLQKSKNKDLIHKAGECFYIIRDYRNAADAYQHVKDENSKYPQVGLKYARSLKQNNDYDEAMTAFSSFINSYQGDDKATLAPMIQTEIEGCALAKDFSMTTNNLPVELEHLSDAVNTPETEFAPFPFNDEILYFSSTMAKRAEIYRTKKINGEWSKAQIPESFPQVKEDHFCNGTLAPDQKRFYFTICKSVENWGGLTTKCDIFVTKRMGNKWSSPERLPDYINMEITTTTHPYVVHQENTEVLYFASNRPEGKGGMDIWYATRDLKSSANDFAYPINAGSKINTAGDEITPFYNKDEEALYFASNGQVSLGGYDIFKAVGNKSFWGKASNLGVPFNSSADDFYFTKTPSGKGGFFVSNRVFGTAKITTTDEDIFSFTANKNKELFAEGGVYDKTTGELLSDVSVAIYEIVDGDKRLLLNDTYADGRYKIILFPEKEYSIEAKKEGFLPKSYEFNTNEYFKYSDFGQPLYIEQIGGTSSVAVQEPIKQATEKITSKLEEVTTTYPQNNQTTSTPIESIPQKEMPKEEVVYTPKEEITPPQKEVITPQPIETTPKTEEGTYRPLEEVIVKDESSNVVRTNVSPRTTPEKPVANTTNNTNEEATKYIIRGKSKRDNYEVITSAPRTQGVYYKIQLIAVQTYNPDHSRYRPLEGMGRIDTEYIVDRKLTRVLLAYYSDFEEAKTDLRKIRGFRNFERAYIVKYKDGERIGRKNN